MTEQQKKISIAVVVCLLFFLIGSYYLKLPAKKTDPLQQTLIGVIDLKQAMKSHPRYADLEKLRGQRALLALSAKKTNVSINEPVLSKQPFDDSAQQQAGQQKNKLLEQQREALAAAEQELRRTTASKREADRKTVSDFYANDIFNCTLRLGNAESLRLSEEQKNGLRQKLNDLKQQRATQMAAVERQYEEYIYSQLQGQRDQYLKEAQAAAQQQQQRLGSEAVARVAMAAERNASVSAAGSRQLSQADADKNSREADLAAKDNEIRLLEDLIVRDIAGKAAKSAIGHHLEYIFADPVVNVSALDVTEEVVNEIKPGKI